jgi:hypothetical protein
MKRIFQSLAVVACVLAVVNARASLDIPDGSTVGAVSTIDVTGLSGTIGSSLSLTLDISGGNNGDLYAYLSYNGTLVTLLNRPGTSSSNPLGFTDSGYSVTVQDAGAQGDLNTATGGSPVTGTYYADGNSSAFTTAYGSASGNGVWTLFLADLSGGDSSDAQLTGFTLSINGTTVPEPVTNALIVFGIFAVAARLAVWSVRRKSALQKV